MNRFNLFIEKFNPESRRILISWKDLNDISPDSKGAAMKIKVAALILNIDQFFSIWSR